RDGKWLASGSTTGEIRLWDTASGKEVRKWSCPAAGDMVLAFSPDGQHLASGVETDIVRFWNPQTGQEQLQLPVAKGESVLTLGFSPDGSKLAVGRRNKAVDLWDWKSKSVVHSLAYSGPAYAVAFSQDGALLAVGGTSKIALFDVAD